MQLSGEHMMEIICGDGERETGRERGLLILIYVMLKLQSTSHLFINNPKCTTSPAITGRALEGLYPFR